MALSRIKSRLATLSLELATEGTVYQKGGCLRKGKKRIFGIFAWRNLGGHKWRSFRWPSGGSLFSLCRTNRHSADTPRSICTNNRSGRSRQAAPVRAIYISALKNVLCTPPGRPLQDGNKGVIRSHCSSMKVWHSRGRHESFVKIALAQHQTFRTHLENHLFFCSVCLPCIECKATINQQRTRRPRCGATLSANAGFPISASVAILPTLLTKWLLQERRFRCAGR
jgi:hypothetical protein